MDSRMGKLLGYLQIAVGVLVMVPQIVNAVQHVSMDLAPLWLSISAIIGGSNHIHQDAKIHGR